MRETWQYKAKSITYKYVCMDSSLLEEILDTFGMSLKKPWNLNHNRLFYFLTIFFFPRL